MKKKLSIRGFSMSVAVIASLHLGLLTLLSVFGMGEGLVFLISSVLPGITSSGPGVFVSMTWGFLIGGTYGFLFAHLYNAML